MDRGLIAFTVTNTHGATVHVPRHIWNEWSTGSSKEALG